MLEYHCKCCDAEFTIVGVLARFCPVCAIGFPTLTAEYDGGTFNTSDMDPSGSCPGVLATKPIKEV